MRLLNGLDAAVIVATHDPEFAAAFADRVVLLADGRVIADGTAAEVLAGGTYFATETARILGGAGGALMPADGVALLRVDRSRGAGVSWQLAAFAILALGLLAGFAWYERTRPTRASSRWSGRSPRSRALGRIAFAAVPNVKPTTVIVLISGYALGGAPGYVVGAVAALTSNFFFGQGPWTPWQMAGWGATGIAGALPGAGHTWAHRAGTASARLLRARLRLHCAPGLRRLGHLQRPQPGPARRLRRQGDRLRSGLRGQLLRVRDAVRAGADPHAPPVPDANPGHLVAAGGACRPATVLWRSSLVGAVSKPAPAAAGVRHGSPVAYLRVRAESGWWLWVWRPGQPSNPMATGWAALALGTRTWTPAACASDGRERASSIWRTPSIRNATPARSSARSSRSARRRWTLPHLFADVNLIARLEAIHPAGRLDRGSDQSDGLWRSSHCARRTISRSARTIAWLVRQQDRDGGFNFATRGGASDVDDTGAALRCDSPGRREHPQRASRRAVAFLRSQQNRDGGFGDQQGAAFERSIHRLCGLRPDRCGGRARRSFTATVRRRRWPISDR